MNYSTKIGIRSVYRQAGFRMTKSGVFTIVTQSLCGMLPQVTPKADVPRASNDKCADVKRF